MPGGGFCMLNYCLIWYWSESIREGLTNNARTPPLAQDLTDSLIWIISIAKYTPIVIKWIFALVPWSKVVIGKSYVYGTFKSRRQSIQYLLIFELFLWSLLIEIISGSFLFILASTQDSIFQFLSILHSYTDNSCDL